MWILRVASRGSKVSSHSEDRLSREGDDPNAVLSQKLGPGVAALLCGTSARNQF